MRSALADSVSRILRRPTRGGRWSAAGFLLAVLLQVASVNAHGGDPTGPFLVGSVADRPDCPWPIAPRSISPSSGYDGQFFLALAFDPTLQDGTAACFDDAPYRARRILWPLVAHVSVLGWAPGIVLSLLLWNALLTALGTGAVARWLALHGHPAVWSLSFPLTLGVVTSLWRGLGDVALASLLVIAFLALDRNRSGMAAVCLAAALLAKETALLAVLGVAAAAVLHRRWRWLKVCALALAPALAWWLYVEMVSDARPGFAAVNLGWPAVGLWDAVVDWTASERSIVRKAKDLAVAGTYLAALLGGIWCLRLPRGPSSPTADALRLSWAGFAVLGLSLSASVWGELWAFSRALLPAVVIGALWQWQRRPGRPFAPGALPLHAAALLGAIFAVYWTLIGSP